MKGFTFNLFKIFINGFEGVGISILNINNRALFHLGYSKSIARGFYKKHKQITLHLLFKPFYFKYGWGNKYNDMIIRDDCVCFYCNKTFSCELFNTSKNEEGDYKSYINEGMKCPNCNEAVDIHFQPKFDEVPLVY